MAKFIAKKIDKDFIVKDVLRTTKFYELGKNGNRIDLFIPINDNGKVDIDSKGRPVGIYDGALLKNGNEKVGEMDAAEYIKKNFSNSTNIYQE